MSTTPETRGSYCLLPTVTMPPGRPIEEGYLALTSFAFAGIAWFERMVDSGSEHMHPIVFADCTAKELRRLLADKLGIDLERDPKAIKVTVARGWDEYTRSRQTHKLRGTFSDWPRYAMKLGAKHLAKRAEETPFGVRAWGPPSAPEGWEGLKVAAEVSRRLLDTVEPSTRSGVCKAHDCGKPIPGVRPDGRPRRVDTEYCRDACRKRIDAQRRRAEQRAANNKPGERST